MEITRYRITVFCLTLVGFATIICYWNCLWFDFVFDDFATVKHSPDLRNPHTPIDILSLKFLTKDTLDNVRPVTVLFTWIDFQIWGLSSFGYHLTNLVLHSLCCLLVYFFSRDLFSSLDSQPIEYAANGNQSSISTGQNLAALGTALLFAVHPVHSEAVCGISYREDLLCTLFFLLSFILFRMVICYVPQYLAQAMPVSPGLFDLDFFETPPIPPLET